MIICDVETSGIDPAKHGIISIGAVNYDQPEQWFYGEGRPMSTVEITDQALAVNGFTREQLAALPDSISTTIFNFFTWVKAQDGSTPLILAGHNPKFDMDFLLAEFNRCGYKKELNVLPYRTIDLHTIAHHDYFVRQGFWYPNDLPAYVIYRKLGISDEPKPHYALNGAVWEAEAISRLTRGTSMFDDFKDYPVKENPWI